MDWKICSRDGIRPELLALHSENRSHPQLIRQLRCATLSKFNCYDTNQNTLGPVNYRASWSPRVPRVVAPRSYEDLNLAPELGHFIAEDFANGFSRAHGNIRRSWDRGTGERSTESRSRVRAPTRRTWGSSPPMAHTGTPRELGHLDRGHIRRTPQSADDFTAVSLSHHHHSSARFASQRSQTRIRPLGYPMKIAEGPRQKLSKLVF